MSNKVFLLSGLGADKRAFNALDLNFTDRIHHIEWLIPIKKESFEHYAKRLIDEYNISNTDTLIGLSFGGLMSVEIQRILNNEKVILISSATCIKELHPFMRITGWLGLDRIIPKKKLNQPNPFLHKGFDIKSEENKLLLNSIIEGSNVDFVHWALSQMSRWNVKRRGSRITKIHGDCDRMIPINNNRNDYTITGGGHFMVVDRSGEVSKLLNNLV